MSLPNNPNWGNINDGASKTQRNPLLRHNRQKVAGFSYENAWHQSHQQQDVAMGPQPMYLQSDQQTYWNNNMSQKPPQMTVSQGMYHPPSNVSWNQQQQYIQHHQQQQHQSQLHQPHQQMQQQFSSTSNSYSVEDPSKKHVAFNSNQQMNYNNSSQGGGGDGGGGGGGGDPWNWDWEDSSNNSPATSFSTNNNFQNDSSWNWEVDDSQEQTAVPTNVYNPVQDYFQPGNIPAPPDQNSQDGKVAQVEQLMNDMNIKPSPGHRLPKDAECGFYVDQEQPQPNSDHLPEALQPLKPEPIVENCTKAIASDNLAEINIKREMVEPVFDIKAEGAQSFQNVNLSNAEEFESERLSPECGHSEDVAETVPTIKSDGLQSFPSGSLSSPNDFKSGRLSPIAKREVNSGSIADSNAIDTSTPPPGLDRMVLGQITENENDTPTVSDVGSHHHHSRHLHLHQSTPPPGLHRMVLGQLTDDQNLNTTEESQNMPSSITATDDIPPPGFHRMIPGESSSPETQNVIQLSMDSLPREQRVVTGVARDEIDVTVLQPSMPSSSPPTPANRLSGQQASQEESRIQYQSERCETIGSDNVDSYAVSTGDSSSAKSSKRKENKDRDRHLEDITSDEGERDQGRRREKDSAYYSQRGSVNREREESPHRDRQRYCDRRSKGRDLLDWERDRRSESPVRYRDDKDRRRDYRDDRRRHLDQYYSDDDDADTNGYFSDRDQRNMAGYRDDYDRAYARRDDRARSLRPEKVPRDRNDDSASGIVKSSVKEPSKNEEIPKSPLTKNNKHSTWPYNIIFSFPGCQRGKDRRRGDFGERDRDRNRDRERDRDRQSDYYRRRGHDDVDDYRDNQRSRPSSRNDSVHDFKHRGRPDYEEDRDRGRDRYRGPPKRDRDVLYPGYNYDPAYYSYYYQYCENLRRTNPAAYAEWCRKYYAQSQQGTFDGSYTEDRGSVHSGRSSANEDNKDRYIHKDPARPHGSPQVYPSYHSLDQSYPYHSYSSDLGDHDSGRRMDLQMEKGNAAIQRLTPAKFTTAHVKGTLTPRGQLIKILAHYPLDGQPATLEIHEQLSCHDEMRRELQDFPGPLVRGVTHKNNILRYCKQKIKEADMNASLYDKESYKLIWELLILLIRQNGTVVGTDIAELLMTNRTAHMSLRQTSSPGASHHGPDNPNLSEEEVTNQFRDYLIYGNSREALEWAMKHGLWGHALFLASKMDQRTYASVMTRFANGLTMNDPLQTLYQLMSGRQPASVTCCADEKWGDWRPHLAMILSNSTARPELDVKTVTTLGDTLGSRGNLHAAHFCYLMAQMEFGSYSHKSSKIVLIGSSHAQPFNQFSTNEAIFATEIFEFACSLADPEFTLHHLQVYKLLIAKRLMEVGLVQEAVHYAEVIATTIAKHPSNYSPQFIQEVYDVGNMLKYSDPVYNNAETVEGSNNDPEWLSRLLNILNDYQMGVLQHDAYGSASNLTTYSENDGGQSLTLDTTTSEPANENQAWQQQQQQRQRYYEQNVNQRTQIEDSVNGFAQPMISEAPGYMSKDQPIITGPSVDDGNQNYWSNMNHWIPPPQQQQQQPQHQEGLVMHGGGVGDYTPGAPVDMIDNKQQQPMYDYFDSNRNEGPKPQITLPNSRQRTVSQSSEKKQIVQAKPKPAKKEPSKNNQGGSWFGGIFNKLPFRPKNQMILPDDKNPSIVWDSDKKRWVNLDGDEDDAGGGIPPPPKASDLNATSIAPSYPAAVRSNTTTEQMPMHQPVQHLPQMPDTSAAPNLPLPPGPNKYKMNRGKSFKSNYVDVMNPGGTVKTSAPSVPAPELFPSYNYSSQLPTNYMIPAPVEGNDNAPTDFLSPSTGPQIMDNAETSQPQALSRWSSTSSLSREVQKYTFKQARTAKGAAASGDGYKASSNQWNGGPSVSQRVPPNLPRMKGYPK